MSRFYTILGCFLIGVGVVGTVSYSASIFPQLRSWAFWMSILVAISFVIAAITDEFIVQYFEIPYKQFIFGLVGLLATVIIGGLIQWR